MPDLAILEIFAYNEGVVGSRRPNQRVTVNNKGVNNMVLFFFTCMWFLGLVITMPEETL